MRNNLRCQTIEETPSTYIENMLFQMLDVNGLPYKHACEAIMQTDSNVHRLEDDHYIVDSYKIVYGSPIYPIPNNDKLMDNSRDLRLQLPITKRRPGDQGIEGLSLKLFLLKSCTIVIVMKLAIIGTLVMKSL